MPGSSDVPHLPRDERRRRSEQAILEAARELFADAGFERTTIRAVASRAGVDPALVMQHYGSKEGLFGAAAQWPQTEERALTADRDGLPEAALRDLFDRFEADGVDRASAVALLRNCLTHPTATQVVRDDVVCDRVAAVAATIGGEDAELRAALLGAVVVGLALSRYLLEVEPLAGASPDDVVRVLGPALARLVETG